MRFLFKFINWLPAKLRRFIMVGIALLLRSMTLGVKIAVIDDEQRVLLVRHTYIDGWHLPGGGVERGETMNDAVHKELQEECNIIPLQRPEHFHVYRNTKTSRFDHVNLYVCRHWEQTEPKIPDFEIAEIGFFPIDGLPREVTKQTRDRLMEIFENQPVRDIW